MDAGSDQYVRRLPILFGLVVAGIWIYSGVQHLAMLHFDDLFPGWVSWEDSGVSHSAFDHLALDLYHVAIELMLPALLAGLLPAVAAIGLRFPASLVALACVLG